MSPYLLLPAAYALGATPTSLWAGKAFAGVDLRTRGSGNLGATNAFRVLGWRIGALVLVADVLKGWAPAWVFPRIQQGGSDWSWALAYGAAAVVGHVLSFWVGFRGGKGVATSGGALFALAPWPALISTAVWVGVVALTRTASLGSLLAAFALPWAAWLAPHNGGATFLGFAVALAVFVFWTHRSNLARLARGEEHRFGRGPAGAPATPGARPEGETGGEGGRPA